MSDITLPPKEPLKLSTSSDHWDSTNLVADSKTTVPTDLANMTATDSKLLTNATSKPNKTNTFGVFSTKQIVKEAKFTKVADDDTKLTSKLAKNKDEVTSLANKTNTNISNDRDLDKASDNILARLLGIKQKENILKSHGSAQLGVSDISILPVSVRATIDKVSISEDDLFDPSTGDMYERLLSEYQMGPDGTLARVSSVDPVNFTTDPIVRSLIPESMPVSAHEGLLDKLKGSLFDLNTCPNFANGGLFDRFGLLIDISWLFDLLGKFDIDGLLACLSEMVSILTSVEQGDMMGKLLDGGSASNLNDMLSMVTPGVVGSTNRDLALDVLGVNMKVTTKGGKLVNTYDDVAVVANSDSILSKLHVDKSSLLDMSNDSINDSILNSANISVVSLNRMNSTPPATKFNQYVLGYDTDQLLGSLPIEVLS
jgi:hypothetical protein